MDEPLIPLRKTQSSKGSSSGSSFLKRISAAAGIAFMDELGHQDNVLGNMLFSSEMLEELVSDKNKARIDELGGVKALARGLGSSLKQGLTGSDDIQRKLKYGANKVERPPPPTYIGLFLEAMQDTTVIILLVAAAVSISLGVLVCVADLGASCPRKPIWGGPVDLSREDFSDRACSSWLDGAAIIIACLIVGNITAWNEMAKEKQFRALQAQQDDCDVTVKRNGIEVRLSAEQLMVGDLVFLEAGAKVPADGVFVKGNDCKVDESSMTGESDEVAKNEDHPFILSGTIVTSGDCWFLVVAVGYRSEWGKILSELTTERDETPLQEKLTVLAEDIGKMGTLVAILCFLAQLVIWFIDLGRETCFYPDDAGNPSPRENCQLGYPGLNDKIQCVNTVVGKYRCFWMTSFQNWNFVKLKDLVSFFIDSVTIIVVAVPEGLPLAVTIALAYSVKKMQRDKNLVRVMAACETMGGCTNICSDKTGTLTQNQMTVTDGYFAGWASEGDLPNPAGPGPALSTNAVSIIAESIACNSKANIGIDGKRGNPTIIGNKTEGALLFFLRTLGLDYRSIRDKYPVVRSYPFSSLKKRMSTIVQNGEKKRLFTKGASEVMLQICDKYVDHDGVVKPFPDELRGRVMQYISKMASQGLRTLTCAYRELAENEAIPTYAEGSDALEKELVCVCICGIKDPLRKEVTDAVKKCRRAGIVVRMCTGDSLLTAKNIAKECGILTMEGTAMEGPMFRRLSPEVQREALQVKELPNGEIQTLQVLARCSPQDKFTLVQRLKEMGEVVAVTGDGTNDAPALKEADVGLSMGISGTAVAQEASDIVIMDDNFSSIEKSVMWGRSVYDNIRRFLQFQLTVNVVALGICMVGAVTGFGTPLKPVQLLWVNLIMDTFGALALATEEPTPDLLDRKPYGRNDKLLNSYMWRNITVQSIFQLVIQLSLLWAGASFLVDCTNDSKVPGCVPLLPNGQGKNTNGNYRDTVIYNSFVWMQLFNEINCRRIYNELNMIDGVLKNPIFVGIWTFCAIVQVLSVNYGGQVFRTVPIDVYDWVLCLAIGSVSLVLGVFQRFLPASLFDFSRAQSSESSKQTPSSVHDMDEGL